MNPTTSQTALDDLLAQLNWQRARRQNPRKPMEVELSELSPMVQVVLEELAAASITHLRAMSGTATRPVQVGVIRGNIPAQCYQVSFRPYKDGDVRVVCAVNDDESGRNGSVFYRRDRIYSWDGQQITLHINNTFLGNLSLEEFRRVIRENIPAVLAHSGELGQSFADRYPAP